LRQIVHTPFVSAPVRKNGNSDADEQSVGGKKGKIYYCRVPIRRGTLGEHLEKIHPEFEKAQFRGAVTLAEPILVTKNVGR
jgi:hypothetical protein